MEESTPLVYLERLKLDGPEPLALDKAWLPERIAAPLLDVDFTPHRHLHRVRPALGGGDDHRRGAHPGEATPAEQQLLGITRDMALFAIERIGCSHGRPVEWRHTPERGGRFTVTADIAAHDGYRLEQADGGLAGLAST